MASLLGKLPTSLFLMIIEGIIVLAGYVMDYLDPYWSHIYFQSELLSPPFSRIWEQVVGCGLAKDIHRINGLSNYDS